jgi:hypothetical protein
LEVVSRIQFRKGEASHGDLAKLETKRQLEFEWQNGRGEDLENINNFKILI